MAFRIQFSMPNIHFWNDVAVMYWLNVVNAPENIKYPRIINNDPEIKEVE